MIKKKEKDHNKIVLLAKTKLNTIEILISRALIDSNIIDDEYDGMKETKSKNIKIRALDEKN